MPDGVNTAMNALKTLGRQAAGQTLAPYAESLELSEGHDSVLVGRKPGDGPVLGTVGEFLTHVRE